MDMLHPSVAAAADVVKQYLQAETLPPLDAAIQIVWIVTRDMLPSWVTAHWSDISLQTHEFFDPPSINVFATWHQKRFLVALLKPANANKSPYAVKDYCKDN